MLIAKMIFKSSVSLMLVGFVVTGIHAQGPGRGGPGGGGMGGMGGMGGGSLALLMMKEVREELNLDEDQSKELEDMGKAMFESMASMRPQPGQNQDSSRPRQPDPKARQEAMEKIRKASEEAEQKLSDILDPNQLDRLIGLVIQRENVRSVNSKLVSEKLGITNEQKDKFANIQKENMEKMGELFQSGGGGFSPETREKMRTLREEADAKMKDVLTAAQKDQMETLKGTEFKFPEPQWGRGGPGGPGGPGGRGGPGGGRGGRGGSGGDGQD